MHEKEIIAGDPGLPREGQAENGELPGAGTGPAAIASAEEQAADGRDAVIRVRARDGIRAWVAKSGRVLLHMTPQAIVTAMTAAALAPVLVPLLGGTVGSYVVQQLLTQLGGAGVAHMAGMMQEVVTRLKGESRVTGVSEETMRNVVDRRLAEELAGPRASAFRAEIAQLLRAVNGVDEALRAAYSSDVQGLGDYVGRAVHELSQTVIEFRTLREDMLGALTSIQRDTTFLRVAAQDHSDELRRLNMNVALLRRKVVIGRPFMDRQAAESAAAGSLTMPEQLVCPYPGLASFGETDAGWFHGRERLTATMINRLRERLQGSSPLIVAGASGAGKSSVLRAGLIPGLDTGGLAEPGSEHWPRVIMTPGPLPLRDLALRLADLAQLPASLVLDELAADPARTPLIIRQALLPREERQRHGVVGTIPDLAARHEAFGVSVARRLILIIDQFEEIFTQCSDGGERKRFVDAICAAAHGTRHDPPAALVVTGLRAGFVEHCTAHPELEPALRDPLIVGPMNSRELRDAIELPARHAGLAVEAGLAATMLRDLGAVEPPGNATLATYDPGKLPLLAHSLRETWERRERGQLTIAAYDAVGGIKDAIASKADQVYGTFDDQSKQVTRRLLEHMVSVHADAEDTRRRMSRSALLSELPTADASIAGRVLDRLEKERLVTADQDTVQIAHEALLRYWPKLAGWVQENRASRREQQRLTEHAREWEDGNRHPDRLLRGAHLAAVRDSLSSVRRAELGTLEAAFLRASETRQGRAERARRVFVATLIALVVLAAGFAAVWEKNSRIARQQQAVAQSTQLAVEANELRASDPQISLLLSLEAYRVAPSYEAVSSLLSAQAGFFNARIHSPFGAVNAVAYDPADPSILATADQNNRVTLWNTTTRIMVIALQGRSPFYAVAFDHAGRFLAGAEQDGTIIIWDASRSYRQVRMVRRDISAVDALAFSPDSSTLATAGDDGIVTLWRKGTWKIASILGVGVGPIAGPISGIAFSPNGNYLAAACADHDVRLWNLIRPSSGLRILQGHTALVRAVAFSPDSRLLASGGDDGTVRLWDVRSGAPSGVLPGVAPVHAVAFSPDGLQLASAGEDNVVRLWDVSTLTQTSALTGPASPVLGVAFRADGHLLASADRNATVGLWNIPAPPRPGSTAVAVATSAPQFGGTLATVGTNQKIILWHALQRNGSTTLPGVTGRAGTVTTHNGGVAFTNMAVSPSGQDLATPAGTRVALWSTRTLKRIGILPAPTQVDAVAYRPSARHGRFDVIAAGGSDGVIYFWGPRKTPPVQLRAPQLSRVNAVAFSPAGTLLAAGIDDGTILLASVTVAGNQITAKLLTQDFGTSNPIEAVAFSPGGRILASASNDGTIQVWNVSNPDNPTLLATLHGHTQAVISVAFSSDSEMLASSADDNTIRIWSVTSPNAPTALATLTGLGSPTSVTFEPDSHIVVAAAADGTPLFWDTKASEVANRICASNPAGNAADLTPFLLGVTYRPVCPAAG